MRAAQPIQHFHFFCAAIFGTFFFLLASSALAAECPLPVKGNITLPTCLISSGKQVGVDEGNITIPAGATIQMENNTELVFESGYYIRVDGYILKPSRTAVIRKGSYVLTGWQEVIRIQFNDALTARFYSRTGVARQSTASFSSGLHSYVLPAGITGVRIRGDGFLTFTSSLSGRKYQIGMACGGGIPRDFLGKKEDGTPKDFIVGSMDPIYGMARATSAGQARQPPVFFFLTPDLQDPMPLKDSQSVSKSSIIPEAIFSSPMRGGKTAMGQESKFYGIDFRNREDSWLNHIKPGMPIQFEIRSMVFVDVSTVDDAVGTLSVNAKCIIEVKYN